MLERAFSAAAARRPARRRRQPQPVRRRVGARACATGSRSTRRRRDRDARRHGAARRPAPCAPRPGALLLYTPVVDDDRLRRRDRVPVAPARRERRAARTSCARCSRSRPARRAWRRERAGSTPRVAAAAHGVDGAAPTAGPPDRAAARSTAEAPFANEPDTDFTTAGEPRMDRAPSRTPMRPRRPPPLVTTRSTRSTRSSRARERCGARLGGDADAERPAPRAHRVAEVMAANAGARSRSWRARPARPSARATPRCPKRSTWRAGPPRRRRCSTSSPATASAVRRCGHRRGRRAVELPVRDPGQRRGRRARGRQRRDPEAGARGGRDRGRARRASCTKPASRPTSCSSCAVPTTTPAATSITHHGVDTVVLTGAYDDRADVPRLEARICG